MLRREQFEAAGVRISPLVRRTPVTYDEAKDLYLKWENRQCTGSFKLRGAMNAVLQLPERCLQAGLIAASSGNHGLAVAYAARRQRVASQIYVASDAAQTKVSAMRRHGALVHLVDGCYRDVEDQARDAAARSDATYLSPYNDWEGIAGAGTIALEWLSQTPYLGRLVVPVGAGALLTGVALAAKAVRADIEVIGVQSAASPFLFRLYYDGHMDGITQGPTIMEGLAGAVEPGAITIDTLPQLCDRMVLITDMDAATAVDYAYRSCGEKIEPSGAAALAAVLSGQVSTTDRPTGVLISGGNIDDETFLRLTMARRHDVQSTSCH